MLPQPTPWRGACHSTPHRRAGFLSSLEASRQTKYEAEQAKASKAHAERAAAAAAAAAAAVPAAAEATAEAAELKFDARFAALKAERPADS